MSITSRCSVAAICAFIGVGFLSGGTSSRAASTRRLVYTLFPPACSRKDSAVLPTQWGIVIGLPGSVPDFYICLSPGTHGAVSQDFYLDSGNILSVSGNLNLASSITHRLRGPSTFLISHLFPIPEQSS